MPMKKIMSWDGKHRRWWKQFKKVKYVVSCRQLNAPETKEGSYQAANRWWEARKAEILKQIPPHEHADYLDLLGKRLVWARQHGKPVNELAAEIERVRNGGTPRYLQTDVAIESTSETPLETLEQQYERELTAKSLDPFDDRWNDRVVQGGIETTAPDLRIGTQADAWLDLRRVRAETGGLSAKGFDNLRHRLKHFTEFVGRDSPVGVIDDRKWAEFWAFVVGKDWSKDHQKGVMTTARIFIERLSRDKLIKRPANLDDSEFAIKVPAKEIPVFTVDEVRRLVDGAKGQTGQTELHVLLMLNTGMTQKDIADLKQTEVNWKAGRIIRKRSKEKGTASVPVVNYRLWPRTFELLKTHRAKGELVLVNAKGNRWVSDKLVNGKFSNYDGIAVNLRRLRLKLGIVERPKDIRKTSSTLLYNNREFSNLSVLFLGQAPRGIAAIHYDRPFDDILDRAVEWLGREYGLID